MRTQSRERLRLALIVAGTLALLWFSVAVSVAGAARDRNPGLALRFWPFDGRARAKQASQLLTGGTSRKALERGRQSALAALRTEPISPSAIGVVALLTDMRGDKVAAKRRFDFARQLSRRDLLTTLWFIEEAVSRNDTAEALHNYNVALLTSRSSQAILFPVLDGALADTEMTRPISRLLASGAEWVPAFVEYVANSGKQPAGLARALLATPASLQPLSDELKASLIVKLVDLGEIGTAKSLYTALPGAAHAPLSGFVNNGDFRSSGRWPPFDWALASSADYGASIEFNPGILSIHSTNGGSGTVARQILALPPGDYDLVSTGTVRSEAAGAAMLWIVNCAGNAEAGLSALTIPPNGAPRLVRGFTVPGSACPWQWLRLQVNSGGEGGEVEAEFDRIEIRRR